MTHNMRQTRAVLFLPLQVNATSGCAEFSDKLTAYDKNYYDYFGEAVALAGTYAVAAAPDGDGIDYSQYDMGVAYVYLIDDASGNAVLLSKIVPPSGSAFDRFGKAGAPGFALSFSLWASMWRKGEERERSIVVCQRVLPSINLNTLTHTRLG